MMQSVHRALFCLAITAVALLVVACGNNGDSGVDATAAAEHAAIKISEPAEGAPVTVPFQVSGEADVFEGALVVQVVDSTGVLCERSVQATTGTGTPGTWSARLAFAPPTAAHEVTLRAFSRSAKDGSDENVVARTVTVSAELPPIVIEAPACGHTTISQSILTVSGTASVSEGSLLVELREPSGSILLTKAVQTVGAPERGAWQTAFDVSAVPAGTYEVVAYSISAKDGSVEHVFAVPFIKAQ